VPFYFTLNANRSPIISKTYFFVFLKYFSEDKKYEYFIVFLNENERMSHLCFAGRERFSVKIVLNHVQDE
jgi:hypothetical protein